MTLVTGSMMTGNPDGAHRIGVMIHYIAMGTVAFGGIVLPMSTIHSRIRVATADGRIVGDEEGKIVIAAPGFFGVRWGAMTPVGIIVGHVVYGVVMALVYATLT